jgi:hypothetical protein
MQQQQHRMVVVMLPLQLQALSRLKGSSVKQQLS